MNPLSLNPMSLLLGVVLSIALGFGCGWMVNGWRLHAAINGMKAKQAEEQSQAEIQAENLRLLQQSAINKIDSAGAAKAKKQATTDQSILSKVETNVPNTLPMLPGSFRVQHDAAAAGAEADDPGQANAAPVAPRTVAAVVTRNYASARSDKANLEELQAIVRASGCFDLKE